MLTVHCHNILAHAWVDLSGDGGEQFYSGVPQHLLHPRARSEKAFASALASKADVICFQEVGLSELQALWASPLAQEYMVVGMVENAKTSAREPNGVCTLLRRGAAEPGHGHRALQLGGATAASLVRCRLLARGRGADVLVVNCHLDYGDTGAEQGAELEAAIQEEGCRHQGELAVIWCGDFNMSPCSGYLPKLAAAGFRDAFEFRDEWCSYCAAGGAFCPGRLDYVLYRGPVEVATERALEAAAASLPQPHGFLTRAASGAARLGQASLLGRFRELAELLASVGSDHAPLQVAFELP